METVRETRKNGHKDTKKKKEKVHGTLRQTRQNAHT